MLSPFLLAVLPLIGCSHDPTQAWWLQGAGYGWELFNHRVAHIEWGVDQNGPTAAFIGGTSTTGVAPQLDDTCDPDTCNELPFLDNANVDLRWLHATSSRVVFARGSVRLVADAAGVQDTLTVALPRKARVALIGGLTIDTSYALSGGDACYNPAYGWHPTRIQIALGDATLSDDGRSVSVTASATFQAGLSLEEMRECIDEVADQAQVPVDLDVVVAVSPDGVQQVDLSDSMTYDYGDGPATPAEQPDPDLADRPLRLSLASPVVGWSALDWRFLQTETDGRGAYLRTLSFDADADAGYASGHATNYSPITQLTGFDYQFTGTVTALDLDGGTIQGNLSQATIPAQLADDGSVVVFDLDW
ncbi:MAG: hypothetical protein GXP62_01040 [Oligoflexia bacterium]|nr:hypothetical protein [Oligoflexia bacterium]